MGRFGLPLRHLSLGTVIYEIIAGEKAFPQKPWRARAEKNAQRLQAP